MIVMPLLTNLAVVLVRLAHKIGNFLRLSRKQMLDTARKTELSVQVEHKRTSLGLHIDSGSECDAENEESLHGANHHRQ